MHSFKQIVEKVLKQEEAFLDPETNELNYTKVKDSADKIDPVLITLLAENKETKEKFFTKIKDVYVFNINDFKFFLDENKINNSYTRYANQIGLSDREDFLISKGDVVLNFPYKDCVLEGGQTTEEGTDTFFEYSDKSKQYEEKTAKRSEIFFNQVLAHDEIDRLFDKKALVGWKRHTKDSGKDGKAVHELQRDENGTIKENLIIKGNNLLALHSLKSEFAGKVKLIYIDPPYNTGNDSFAYNDNFNHSTWLSFMKNRLEIAKEFLTDDGVIFISADENEYTYLKVLMDDIKDLNFENIFHIKVRHENRILRQDSRYQKVMEQLICYGKAKFNPNRIFLAKDKNIDYQYDIKIKANSKPLAIEKINGYMVEIYPKNSYEIQKNKHGLFKEYNIRGSLITQRGSASEFYEKFLRSRKKIDGLVALYKVIKMGEKGDGIGYRFIRQPLDNGNNGFYYQGKPKQETEDKGNPYPNYYDFENAFNNSADEGGITFKNGKKPEIFLSKVFEIAGLKKGDIVLDYHAGSGTTCAVAQKMNYQWIGIEQMDYIHDLPEARLINVINGDNTGISKSVNWQGGGSFIYCELAKWNEQAKKEINNAKDLKALEKMFNALYEQYFLNYNVKIKEFKEKVLKEENFKTLTLVEQKKMFLTMLDLNQIYVQESEMADKRYGISKEDQKLTKSFYSK